MAKRMLIDATHPEETRVVVISGKRLEEFDFETASKKQLKGNIYLAKVTRVEPSLQAAFVEYGGNRHGFLAFNEIHPDYYRIPVADRQALLAEEAAYGRRGGVEENGIDDGRAMALTVSLDQIASPILPTEPGPEPAAEAVAPPSDGDGPADAAVEPAADGDGPANGSEPAGAGVAVIEAPAGE